MCRQVTCRRCSKPTWSGCGAHVEQVLGHVAPGDRCSCETTQSKPGGRLRRILGG